MAKKPKLSAPQLKVISSLAAATVAIQISSQAAGWESYFDHFKSKMTPVEKHIFDTFEREVTLLRKELLERLVEEKVNG